MQLKTLKPDRSRDHRRHPGPSPRAPAETRRGEPRIEGEHPWDAAAVEKALREQIGGEVHFDSTYRALYSTDGSNYRRIPLGVVVPRTYEDVEASLRICREHGVPLVSRGGGTSLNGQCCTNGVVLDFSKHLNKILEIDPQRRIARVQPGVVLDDLRNAAQEHGLTFAPDPSTHDRCTLGGMLGNNSCGVHSVIGGRVSDNVQSMEVLTYDGLRLTVGAVDEAELDRLAAEDGRIGEIYRGIRDIRTQYADRIRERYPDIPRRVSGYNLDDLLPEGACHVARSLVGSEGTLVVALEATVRLVPWPKERVLAVLGYDSVYDAADHVMEILEYEPIGLEGLDRMLTHLMERQDLHAEELDLFPDGDGFLLVEFGGETKQEAMDKARRMIDAIAPPGDDPGREPPAQQAGGPSKPNAHCYDDPKLQKRVWEVREAGLAATAFVPAMGDTWPGWEDAGVDPRRLGDYLRAFRDLLERYDYTASLYGHFGQGCIHCRIDFDLVSREGIDKWKRFLEEAADLVLEHNGSFSGEHGDGINKSWLLPKMFGDDIVEAFGRFKALWDPDNGMNPGKIVDPLPVDSHLRLGADFRPQEPKTYFQYDEDRGSFARATMRCVGVGKCRLSSGVFMCPSYMATRDEKDTTRGRARVLFEMMRGDYITDGWKSEEAKEALDLCIGCKGCKKECPVDVDMATYKSEFLAHYYQGRRRPRDFYAMGFIERWARLASIAPAVANFFAHAPGLASASKWIAGVSQHRDLPRFAHQPFTRWFRRREPQGTGERGQVVLLVDSFNDYFFPGTLIAATRVLEHLGWRVRLPERRIPEIRPLIHYGFLAQAKPMTRNAIAHLDRHAAAGTAIVGVEPSSVSVFREESRTLFPHDHAGYRVAQRTSTLSEFLLAQDAELPRPRGRALLHAHCHQKAVLDAAASRTLLSERMGMEVLEPEVGCCGMAGSFGFEHNHYDVSQRIGELNLLPAVRRADDDVAVIIEGFSCREQIRQSTPRAPEHIAEFILRHLENA